jgi:hypothetical protein
VAYDRVKRTYNVLILGQLGKEMSNSILKSNIKIYLFELLKIYLLKIKQFTTITMTLHYTAYIAMTS